MLHILFFGSLLACQPKHPTTELVVDGTAITVEVANNQAAHQEGLMNRDSLGADKGMIFVYKDKAPRSFWMKDTRIPLSIAFIDDDGKILKIADMRPHDTSRTKSLYPVGYALEVNQGWFAEHGVEKGDMVTGLPPRTQAE